MKASSKLIRVVVLVSSLALLTIYVVYSQSKGRTTAPQKEEEFMLPSSKALTQPVFSIRKLDPTPAP